MNNLSFSIKHASVNLLHIIAFSFFACTAQAIAPAPSEHHMELIESLLEQKQTAIILFHRPSCPLSLFSVTLLESLKPTLFKKQVRSFALEINPATVRTLKDKFNTDYSLKIESVPFFIFIKNGEIVHYCEINGNNMKQTLVTYINALYPSI